MKRSNKLVLIFLASFVSLSLQSSADIYLSSTVHQPSADLHQSPVSINPPELNAILSHQLDLSDYEHLPKNLFLHTLKNHQIIFDHHSHLPQSQNIPQTDSPRLILLVYGAKGSKLFPSQITKKSVHLTLENPPDRLSFDGLISTYIGRLIQSKKASLSSIFGFNQFLKAYHDGIGLDILNHLENWLNEWEASQTESLEWAKKSIRSNQINDSDAQVLLKEEYSRWLNPQGILDPSARWLIEDLKVLDQFTETLLNSDSPPPISLVRLSGLEEIQRRHGENSRQYRSGFETLEKFLKAALSTVPESMTKVMIGVPGKPFHTRKGKQTSLSVLTPFQTSETSFVKRALIERRRSVFGSGKTPIIASSRKCYDEQAECEGSTDKCNGHGQCVEGQKTSGGKCFVCVCVRSKNEEGKLVDWSGEMCQKQDISSGFVLLAGSVIGLMVLLGMSIRLLVSIGSESLPSQLSSVSGTNKKMD